MQVGVLEGIRVKWMRWSMKSKVAIPCRNLPTNATKKFLVHSALVQALALSVVSGHDKPPLAHLVRKNVRAVQHGDYIGPRGLCTYQRLLRTTLAWGGERSRSRGWWWGGATAAEATGQEGQSESRESTMIWNLIVEVPSLITDNGTETLISFNVVSSFLYQLLTSKKCWI